MTIYAVKRASSWSRSMNIHQLWGELMTASGTDSCCSLCVGDLSLWRLLRNAEEYLVCRPFCDPLIEWVGLVKIKRTHIR